MSPELWIISGSILCSHQRCVCRVWGGQEKVGKEKSSSRDKPKARHIKHTLFSASCRTVQHESSWLEKAQALRENKQQPKKNNNKKVWDPVVEMAVLKKTSIVRPPVSRVLSVWENTGACLTYKLFMTSKQSNVFLSWLSVVCVLGQAAWKTYWSCRTFSFSCLFFSI